MLQRRPRCPGAPREPSASSCMRRLSSCPSSSRPRGGELGGVAGPFRGLPGAVQGRVVAVVEGGANLLSALRRAFRAALSAPGPRRRPAVSGGAVRHRASAASSARYRSPSTVSMTSARYRSCSASRSFSMRAATGPSTSSSGRSVTAAANRARWTCRSRTSPSTPAYQDSSSSSCVRAAGSNIFLNTRRVLRNRRMPDPGGVDRVQPAAQPHIAGDDRLNLGVEVGGRAAPEPSPRRSRRRRGSDRSGSAPGTVSTGTGTGWASPGSVVYRSPRVVSRRRSRRVRPPPRASRWRPRRPRPRRRPRWPGPCRRRPR